MCQFLVSIEIFENGQLYHYHSRSGDSLEKARKVPPFSFLIFNVQCDAEYIGE